MGDFSCLILCNVCLDVLLSLVSTDLGAKKLTLLSLLPCGIIVENSTKDAVIYMIYVDRVCDVIPASRYPLREHSLLREILAA